jgi:hypothetical protein
MMVTCGADERREAETDGRGFVEYQRKLLRSATGQDGGMEI